MDSLAVLAGLFGMGKYLSGHANKQENIPAVFDRRPVPVGAREYDKVSQQVAHQVSEHWKKAQDPRRTNIIPYYFNTLEMRGDLKFVPNADHDPAAAAKILQLSDKDTQRLSSKNGQWTGPLAPFQKGENAAIDQIGGSLLPGRDLNQQTHINMAPFYRGTIKQNTDTKNRMGAGKLQSFTGQFGQLRRPNKCEVKPLFAPSPGYGNVFGNREHRDLSRYFPSNIGKKHNELPFEQIRVGRGVSDGYTAKPSGGFHQQVQIRPKKTEDLYVNTNFETEGRINHGKALNGLRPSTQQIAQNRPKVLVTNLHGERNFASLAAVKGPKIEPKHQVKHTNRKRTRSYAGGAAPATSQRARKIPKSKISTRQNFSNTPYRNLTKTHSKQHNDYGKNGITNYPTARASTSRVDLLNPISWVKRMQQYLQDAPRKTRKQHYVDHPRPNGNIKPDRKAPHVPLGNKARTTIRETTENSNHRGYAAPLKKKSIVYDPHHKARTTIRETTEQNHHNGNLRRSSQRGVVYDKRHKARTTIKETTEEKNHRGWIGGTRKQGKTYSKSWTPQTTTKELTVDNRHTGHVQPTKLQVHVPLGNQAKTTIKETTENSNYTGAVGSLKKKSIVYDPNHRARTTVKETTEQNKHAGHLGPSQRKGIAYDKRHKARTTIKETTHSDYTGGMNNQQLQNTQGYQVRPVKAKNTNKQFTSDNPYSGVAKSTQQQKTMSYDSAYNSTVNDRKEKIARGRHPTWQGVKSKNQSVNVESKKIEDDRFNRRGHFKDSSIGYTYYGGGPGNMTADKNGLPEEDWRLDPSLLKSFKENPLTQSLGSY